VLLVIAAICARVRGQYRSWFVLRIVPINTLVVT
jgi:hypothetical protein